MLVGRQKCMHKVTVTCQMMCETRFEYSLLLATKRWVLTLNISAILLTHSCHPGVCELQTGKGAGSWFPVGFPLNVQPTRTHFGQYKEGMESSSQDIKGTSNLHFMLLLDLGRIRPKDPGSKIISSTLVR